MIHKLQAAPVASKLLVLGEKLGEMLSEINMEKAFINDAFKEKIVPYNHQLEVLAYWSKPENI